MQAVAENKVMARPKKEAPVNMTGMEVTKIDREVLRQARTIIAFDGGQKGLGEFLSDILRPVVQREYDKRIGPK